MSLRKNSGNPKTSSGCWNLKLERLEVRDVPAGLVANADDYVVFDGQLSVDPNDASTSGLMANDENAENATVALVEGSLTGPGDLTLNPDGSFSFSTAFETAGEISFDYTVTDGSDTQQARVTLNLQHSPRAFDFTTTGGRGETLALQPPLDDLDGDDVSFVIVSEGQFGTIQFNDGGLLLYVPNDSGFEGVDTFQFQAFANGQYSNVATGTVVLGGPLQPADDTVSTTADTPVTVLMETLLANDGAQEGDTFTVTEYGAPSFGSLEFNGDGGFTYTPNEGFVGQDTFTYTITDFRGRFATANVVIDVAEATGNTPPTAFDAAFSVREDRGFGGVLLGADVDGDAITFALAGGPANGRLVFNTDGSFTYRPNPNFNGTDSFTFRTNDGTDSSGVATVTISVAAVNDRPTMSRASFSVLENSPAGTSVGTVGGADVDGDTLTYSITGGNRNGAFAIDPATGAITVANPAALDFESRRTFNLTVRATDPGGRSAAARVTIRILDVNENRRANLDIVLGDSQNRISLRDATVEVAILGAADLDVGQIDVNSLRFGRTGRENSIVRNAQGVAQFQLRDVNGDGRLDLVVRFNVDDTRLRVNDARAYLTGDLTNGGELTGDGTVSVRR
jgi:VCBS repeat-containing protein